MGELSEVPVSSPACYTIEDDDEPEVIFVSDNLSEEDSRDGEPSSTTSDINGDDGAQCDGTVDYDECIDDGTQQETSESSDEDEGSGNVLNDFIKLIDLVKSYEKVDKTVKTKFKDGFLFLENLQTQFEETEKNNTEKNEMIAELIVELNKLKGDNKQLKEENEQLKENNQQLNENNEQLNENNEQLNENNEQLNENNEQLKENNQRLKEGIQQLTQDNQQLNEDNKQLKEDNKQLKGEMNTQSLQFGMLRSKHVKLEEEMNGLKISVKMLEAPPAPMIPMPTNMALEMMKSKADKLQHLFKQLCSKMSEETLISSDPESVKKSRGLKSFQNEVGVLFIKVQHKLSKWAKNQVKMEEELERCRMSLDQLHDMVTIAKDHTFDSQMETLTPPPIVELSTNQPANKKRKLPPPPLVPLNIHIPNNPKFNSDTPVNTVQQNTNTLVQVPNELPKTSPALDSVDNSDGNVVRQLTDMKIEPSCVTSLQISIPLSPSPSLIQPSPPAAVPKPLAPPPTLKIKLSPLPAAPMKVSPSPVVPIQPSPPLVFTSSSPLPLLDTRTSSPQPSPSLYQLPPLPPLNFPLSPLKPIVSKLSPTSSSGQVTSPVPSVSPKAQAAQVKPPVKRRRRRAKTIRTTPPHLPQTTSVESRFPFNPPQASYPVHPQYNQYSVSQYTPNGTLHQTTFQAYHNQMMQLPSNASQFLPHQQQQISSSSAPPVSTKNTISPASIPETNKQTNVTPQNKCQVCAMTFATPIQLKLHHAVVHSNKTPSSALTRPAILSPPASTSSSHQQNCPRPLLVAPPPLQERHQNAASLRRVPSIATITSTGTTTTTWPTNEPDLKRHCIGLSPLAAVVPTSSITKCAQVAPVLINNKYTNSLNSTQSYDNNNFVSWLDLL